MVKITGTQNVPSALLDAYRSTLEEATPKNAIAKRYPYRLPTMQNEGGHPSVAQRTQRARFKTAFEDFANVDAPTRTRWYDAQPPWGSFLWYYNYFIMSSLLGNATPNDGGFGVIKTIQHKLISVPAGSGEGQVAITAVDADKTVVMISGASIAEGQTGDIPYACIVYPYISSIASELIKAKWSLAAPFGNNTKAATISTIVIEYI